MQVIDRQRDKNNHNLKGASSNPAPATNSPPAFEGGFTSPDSPGFFCGDARASSVRSTCCDGLGHIVIVPSVVIGW